MRDARRTVLVAAVLAAALILVVTGSPQETATVTTPAGTIQVAVADTPQERQEGLMGRSQVPLDGMLFVFPRPAQQTFWMKDTRVPLDIVFIGEDGRVLNVAAADPEPGVPEENLTRYRSDGPALYVLEVPQGDAEELGLDPGAAVTVQR
ncbi:MAG: DUF192 domain-containing protein [Candidatus Nanohaloarchaea archaeon]|nr:DUF192 domain-containing protein [Candidatus Nanohaloarchaea archaeon]